MKYLVVIGAIVGVGGCLLYGFKYGISHLIDYEPRSDGINFVMFRTIRIFVLKYNNIETCKPYKLFDFRWSDGRLRTIFLTLTIGGWPRLTRVMLKMKHGPFTYISLFPREPIQFASAVQAYIAATGEAL